MPGTAAAYGLDDPFDAEAAIDAQAHLMSDLLGQFGAVALALAAYNAGPAPVAACDCVPAYPETQAYVARILGLMDGAGAIAAGAGARGAAGRLSVRRCARADDDGDSSRLRSMAPLTVTGIDELRELIGEPIGPTDWVEVTQADIDKFAEVSRDDQWIHVDVERAERESPFGTTVAHGNLTLSLIDGFRRQLIRQEGVDDGDQLRLEQGPLPGAGAGRLEGPRDRRGAVGRRARRRLVARRRPSSRSSARAARSRSASPSRSAAPSSAELGTAALAPGASLDRQRALHAGLAVGVDRAVVGVVARLELAARAVAVSAADHVGARELVAVGVLDDDVVAESRPGCRTRS